MISTKDVIDNHIRRFREGDIDGIVDDYSTDAVLFTPAGPLKGRSEIKTLFQTLLAEFGRSRSSSSSAFSTISCVSRNCSTRTVVSSQRKVRGRCLSIKMVLPSTLYPAMYGTS